MWFTLCHKYTQKKGLLELKLVITLNQLTNPDRGEILSANKWVLVI
jgi:hypothetical protein